MEKSVVKSSDLLKVLFLECSVTVYFVIPFVFRTSTCDFAIFRVDSIFSAPVSVMSIVVMAVLLERVSNCCLETLSFT